MAALASNEILIESMMNNLEWIDFGHRHREAVVHYYDDYLLERVKVETWCRNNKQYIERVFEGVIDFDSDNALLSEQESFMGTLLTDLTLGVATSAPAVAKLSGMVPGLGQAVAAGGTLYYIARALRSYRRGEKMAMYFEIFSAVMASAGFIPGVGSVLSAIGNTIMAPFKWFFTTIWGGTKSLFGRFFTTVVEEGVENSGPIVKEMAEGFKSVPGAEAGVQASGKLRGVIDKVLNFFKSSSGPGEKVAAELGAENVGIITKGLEKLKSMLGIVEETGEVLLRNPAAAEGGKEGAEALMRSATVIEKEIAETAAVTGEQQLVTKLNAAKKEFEVAKKGLEAADDAVRVATRAKDVEAAALKQALQNEKALAGAVEETVESVTKNLDDIVNGVSNAASKATNMAPTELAKALDNMGSALGGLGDDVLENAAPAVEAAFKKGGAEAFEANLNKMLNPRTGNLSQEAFESFMKNAEKFVIQNMEGGSAALAGGDDVLKLFSQTFCGESGPVLSKIVFEGAEAGAISGTGGIKFVFSATEGAAKVPFTLVQMTEFFVSQGAARIMSETFTSPSTIPIFEQMAEEAAEKLTSELAKQATAKAAVQDASAAIVALEKQIAALPKPKITPKTVGDAIKSGVDDAVENGVTSSKGLWKMISDAWVRDYSKAYAMNLKPMLTSTLGSTTALELDTDYGEKIDSDMGTINDPRLSKVQRSALQARQSGDFDDGYGVTAKRSSGRGIKENLELDNIIWESKRRTKLIRTQKLIGLIN